MSIFFVNAYNLRRDSNEIENFSEMKQPTILSSLPYYIQHVRWYDYMPIARYTRD